MKVCTICARGGSKGVKNKNLRLIEGITLVAHSIMQAKDSQVFDVIAVSSDSDDILAEARNAGADVLIKRPDDLATDLAAKLPAMKHAVLQVEKIKHKEATIIIDLDCTSPLRNREDILTVVGMLVDTNIKNVITGCRARRSPYFNLVERQSDGSVSLAKNLPITVTRRQDVPICYDMNASIYGWRREDFFCSESVIQAGTFLYEMPEERSLDIDSELDFKIVSFLLSERKRDALEK